ncbi:uncharacterized protein LOC133197554 [Saccostrea echinata]|uniref:uncharacterized protein LOC133197554 n=1 Tax=Saccostrea echinata TaxID=191078 RepID=UPI002A8009EB|nr:uncharacterized protein LOC133197554 [Saccostrea echinata]
MIGLFRKICFISEQSRGLRFISQAPSNRRKLYSIGCLSIAITTAGFYVVRYSILHDTNFRTVTQSTALDRDRYKQYKNPEDIAELQIKDHQKPKRIFNLKDKLGNQVGAHIPVSLIGLLHFNDPHMLVLLTQSADPAKRKKAVQTLGTIHHWPDEKYEWVRKACDSRTLVGLARTEDVDGRFFTPFPTPDKLEGDLESGLKVLLSSLPKDGFSKCLEYFTTQALIEGNIEEERGGYWSFGGPGVDFAKTVSRGPEERVEIICLQALISHSNEPHHCFEMMKMGVLPLLQQTYHKRKYSIVMRRQIARILGNLSVHEELHPEIIKGGWVSLLYKWSKSSDLQLSLHASRALVNLDRDDGTFLYPSGVYLVHPTKRSKDPVMADVVFVHGLLGGPFKTWRQQDRKMPDKDNVAEGVASVRKGTYTFCWPKDWLSKDVPFVRILSVEYDTNLSTWNANCPYETEKRSLPRRASELQKKLKAAGVGSRPIIWVTHSMGGLLVKEVLSQSNLHPDCSDIVHNTSGVIFYSTPHRGSALANISNRGSRIFSPTVEVQELSQDSLALRTLHNNFKQIVSENRIKCLSFGETEKQTVGYKRIKLLIVPPESSDPGIGEFHPLSTTHLNVCKPWDQNSELYLLTVKFIKHCIMLDPVNRILKTGNVVHSRISVDRFNKYSTNKDMEKKTEYEKSDPGKEIESREKEEQVIDGFKEGQLNDEEIARNDSDHGDDGKKEIEESLAEIVEESVKGESENGGQDENEANSENEADNEREESLKEEEGANTDNVKTGEETVIKSEDKEIDHVPTGEDNTSKDFEDSEKVKNEMDMKPKDSSQMENGDSSVTLSKSEITPGDIEDSDVISNGFEVIPDESVNIPFTHYVDHKNLIRSGIAGQTERNDGEMELTHLLKGYKNSNKELKDFHRKNSWDTHHTIRGQLWVRVCETLHKAKGNLYEDYEKDLFHQRNTDDIALPPFVDFNNLTSYHLSEQGTKTVAKILAIIQNTNPEILYCPTLYAKLSIFLHYMGPSDAFNCIYALLRSKDACIMQTKVAVEASKLVLRDLTKKYAKSAYVYLVRHSSDITSVFDSWMWWLFSDLPFPHIVRILDCYLVEGVKVLYRIVLAILILFTKYSVSAKQHHHGVITDTYTVSERIRQFCTNMPFPVEKLLKRGFRIRGLKKKEIKKLQLRHEMTVSSQHHLQQEIQKSASTHSFSGVPHSHSFSGRIVFDQAQSSIVTSSEMTRSRSMGLLTFPPVESLVVILEDLYTIWSWLPARCAVCQPELLYTSEEHGTSLRTLYTRIENHQPTLILIKTTTDEVFGAFCSMYWRERKKSNKNVYYFGTGETFVFTLYPEKKKYEWVGLHEENIPSTANMFLAGDSKILTVGGGNGEAIQLDENLLHCRTEHCDTFDNPPLCSHEDFTCKVVEVYGFQ